MKLSLDGKWEMRRVDIDEWVCGTVPGSVYNDLLSNGLMEDPYYRDNEYKIMEISSFDYEYRREFEIGTEELNEDLLVLHCCGMDTLADIYINGRILGTTENMHRTYEFDIKNFVKAGSNTIRVLFHSPVAYITKKNEERYLWGSDSTCINGMSHIRKAHCMFGWDWGPKLPDMGIWRSISILGFDTARLEEVYLTQRHSEGSVKLKARVTLKKFREEECSIKVRVISPEGCEIHDEITTSGIEENLELQIEKPKLWWPRGYGGQPLYKVVVEVYGKEEKLDSREYKVGLRTVRVRQEDDQWGRSFCFNVNGVDIFAMGADYIPEDNILARCSPERTEKLIRDCAAANFNSIRIWGGGYYPEDYFYDLCDRYGILIWQDFMFACAVYELTEEFKNNIVEEIKDNVRRIRYHASLGLWCGNNEMESGWESWGFPKTPQLKADYIKQFEYLMPELMKELDPETFYWPSSPSSFGSFDRPNDENYGDMHDWSIWHGRMPFTDYRNRFPRFMSEFGIESFPSLKTIESFTLPEDRNIFSYVMENHQKCASGNENILYYMSQYYKFPKDLEKLIYLSQIVQAEGLRYGVEHWRRNRGRCMAAVYWQLNDIWPVASWSSIDYYGRWKALHYCARRFFAPVLLSAFEEDTRVSLHVTNETMEPVSGKLIWNLRNGSSTIVVGAITDIDVEPLSTGKFFERDFGDFVDTEEKRRQYYIEYKFVMDDKEVSGGTALFIRPKYYELQNPEVQCNVEERAEDFLIKVSASQLAKGVELSFESYDAVFSDNYFDICGGETIEVAVSKDQFPEETDYDKIKNDLIIKSLYDSF
ncbi:MAG: glycoside hydrolase family 2 protein [Bacillota bacterium]|nr:glycoside hydrolase family 2 protein [Bacillota bacterium]